MGRENSKILLCHLLEVSFPREGEVKRLGRIEHASNWRSAGDRGRIQLSNTLNIISKNFPEWANPVLRFWKPIKSQEKFKKNPFLDTSRTPKCLFSISHIPYLTSRKEKKYCLYSRLKMATNFLLLFSLRGGGSERQMRFLVFAYRLQFVLAGSRLFSLFSASHLAFLPNCQPC